MAKSVGLLRHLAGPQVGVGQFVQAVHGRKESNAFVMTTVQNRTWTRAEFSGQTRTALSVVMSDRLLNGNGSN